MTEVTCYAFVAVMDDALAAMQRQWAEAQAGDPRDFPERMSLADWWLHFSAVVAPEAILNAYEAERRRAGGPRLAA